MSATNKVGPPGKWYVAMRPLRSGRKLLNESVRPVFRSSEASERPFVRNRTTAGGNMNEIAIDPEYFGMVEYMAEVLAISAADVLS